MNLSEFVLLLFCLVIWSSHVELYVSRLQYELNGLRWYDPWTCYLADGVYLEDALVTTKHGHVGIPKSFSWSRANFSSEANREKCPVSVLSPRNNSECGKELLRHSTLPLMMEKMNSFSAHVQDVWMDMFGEQGWTVVPPFQQFIHVRLKHLQENLLILTDILQYKNSNGSSGEDLTSRWSWKEILKIKDLTDLNSFDKPLWGITTQLNRHRNNLLPKATSQIKRYLDKSADTLNSTMYLISEIPAITSRVNETLDDLDLLHHFLSTNKKTFKTHRHYYMKLRKRVKDRRKIRKVWKKIVKRRKKAKESLFMCMRQLQRAYSWQSRCFLLKARADEMRYRVRVGDIKSSLLDIQKQLAWIQQDHKKTKRTIRRIKPVIKSVTDTMRELRATEYTDPLIESMWTVVREAREHYKDLNSLSAKLKALDPALVKKCAYHDVIRTPLQYEKARVDLALSKVLNNSAQVIRTIRELMNDSHPYVVFSSFVERRFPECNCAPIERDLLYIDTTLRKSESVVLSGLAAAKPATAALEVSMEGFLPASSDFHSGRRLLFWFLPDGDDEDSDTSTEADKATSTTTKEKATTTSETSPSTNVERQTTDSTTTTTKEKATTTSETSSSMNVERQTTDSTTTTTQKPEKTEKPKPTTTASPTRKPEKTKKPKPTTTTTTITITTPEKTKKPKPKTTTTTKPEKTKKPKPKTTTTTKPEKTKKPKPTTYKPQVTTHDSEEIIKTSAASESTTKEGEDFFFDEVTTLKNDVIGTSPTPPPTYTEMIYLNEMDDEELTFSGSGSGSGEMDTTTTTTTIKPKPTTTPRPTTTKKPKPTPTKRPDINWAKVAKKINKVLKPLHKKNKKGYEVAGRLLGRSRDLSKRFNMTVDSQRQIKEQQTDITERLLLEGFAVIPNISRGIYKMADDIDKKKDTIQRNLAGLVHKNAPHIDHYMESAKAMDATVKASYRAFHDEMRRAYMGIRDINALQSRLEKKSLVLNDSLLDIGNNMKILREKIRTARAAIGGVKPEISISGGRTYTLQHRVDSSTFKPDSLSFHLRTTQPDGALLAIQGTERLRNGQRRSNNRLSIGLDQGKLTVYVEPWRRTWVLPTLLNDGQWHRISIYLQDSDVILTSQLVNTTHGSTNHTVNREVFRRQESVNIKQYLSSKSYLLIFGMLPYSSWPFRPDPDFRACFSQLKIGNYHMPMFNIEDMRGRRAPSCVGEVVLDKMAAEISEKFKEEYLPYIPAIESTPSTPLTRNLSNVYTLYGQGEHFMFSTSFQSPHEGGTVAYLALSPEVHMALEYRYRRMVVTLIDRDRSVSAVCRTYGPKNITHRVFAMASQRRVEIYADCKRCQSLPFLSTISRQFPFYKPELIVGPSNEQLNFYMENHPSVRDDIGPFNGVIGRVKLADRVLYMSPSYTPGCVMPDINEHRRRHHSHHHRPRRTSRHSSNKQIPPKTLAE